MHTAGMSALAIADRMGMTPNGVRAISQISGVLLLSNKPRAIENELLIVWLKKPRAVVWLKGSAVKWRRPSPHGCLFIE